MRRAPFRTVLLVACASMVVGAPLAAGAGEGVPAERVPPRPVEVSEVDDAPDGELIVEPPQIGLALEPGTADLAELRIVNGSEVEVSLDAEVVPVGAGPGGAPQVPAEGEPVPSAADWLRVPTLEVHLAPSEAAAYRPAVAVPDGTDPGGYLAAVQFVGRGAEDDEAEGAEERETAGADERGGAEDGGGGPEVVAFVLVHVPDGGDDAGGDGAGDGGVSVSLRRVDPTTAVATTTLDAGRWGAVDVTGQLRIRSWYGSTLVDTEIPTTLVLPTVPRDRPVELRAPVIPGPYGVSVEAAGPDRPLGAASARAWLWNPAAVVALALTLLVLSAWLLYRTVRRGRAGR